MTKGNKYKKVVKWYNLENLQAYVFLEFLIFFVFMMGKYNEWTMLILIMIIFGFVAYMLSDIKREVYWRKVGERR